MVKECIQDIKTVFGLMILHINNLQGGLVSYRMRGKVAEISYCVERIVNSSGQCFSRIRFRKGGVNLYREVFLQVTSLAQYGL